MKVLTILFVQLHNALQALEAHALISKVEYLVTPSWLKSSGGHKPTKCDTRIFLSMNGCTQIHTPVHYCWDNIILSSYLLNIHINTFMSYQYIFLFCPISQLPNAYRTYMYMYSCTCSVSLICSQLFGVKI